MKNRDSNKLNNALPPLTIGQMVRIRAIKEGIPESEVKLKLAIPRKDGRTEMTYAEYLALREEWSKSIEELEEIIKTPAGYKKRLKQ